MPDPRLSASECRLQKIREDLAVAKAWSDAAREAAAEARRKGAAEKESASEKASASGDKPQPKWLGAEEGSSLASSMEPVAQGISDDASTLEDMRGELESASSDAEEHSALEDDFPDVDSKEYATWEKENTRLTEAVAEKAKAMHDHLSTMVKNQQDTLAQLDKLMAGHAATHD